MTRRADPERKPQLTAEILDFLRDRPLTSLTFRNVAEHLHVSTFTLVYHFGSKNGLVTEIVAAIAHQQVEAILRAEVPVDSVENYFEGIGRYWRWAFEPENRHLQRLEFEAGMLEALAGDDVIATRHTLTGWHRRVAEDLRKLGVPDDSARAEARAMVSLLYGLQYDLTVLGERDGVAEAFDSALASYRDRIGGLVKRDERDERDERERDEQDEQGTSGASGTEPPAARSTTARAGESRHGRTRHPSARNARFSPQRQGPT